MGPVSKDRVEQVVEQLIGTARNIPDVLTEEESRDNDFLDAIFQRVFECEGCGWWFDRDDESDMQPDHCTDCAADTEDI
jgi:hypothetical protein